MDYLIGSSDILEIDKIKLRNLATITNDGTITVIGGDDDSEGQLINDIDSASVFGSIINDGTINLNSGISSNTGNLRSLSPGGIENYGTINANGGGGISSATIDIQHAFGNPAAFIANNGTINLDAGATLSARFVIDDTLTNNGIINNDGFIEISGTLTNNNTIHNGIFNINSKITIFTQGTLTNVCDGVIDGIGAILDQFGNPVTANVDPNCPPDCSNATASTDILYQDDTIWPPNHKMETVFVQVTYPDGDAVTVTVYSIFQDEPTNGLGDGDQSPDGVLVGADEVQARAERSGVDNGRVYHIAFTADDGNGGMCTGEVFVQVPHDKKSTAIDDGALYDSTTS